MWFVYLAVALYADFLIQPSDLERTTGRALLFSVVSFPGSNDPLRRLTSIDSCERHEAMVVVVSGRINHSKMSKHTGRD